jgi:hypothetical protein
LCDRKNVTANEVKNIIKNYEPTKDEYVKLLKEYKNKRDWL